MGKKVKVDRKDKRQGFFKGFKDFIARGNVIDLAIGVIIGGAFGKIVTSLVNDIIMPPIALLIGDTAFEDLVVVLKSTVNEAGELIPLITWNYGKFILIVIEFLIIAFVIYAALTLVIRRKQFIEKLEAEKAKELEAQQMKEKAKEEPKESEEIKLLREIRDSLKDK